jgi:hypothetical protein
MDWIVMSSIQIMGQVNFKTLLYKIRNGANAPFFVYCHFD